MNRSLDPVIKHWEQNYILTSSVFVCEPYILMLSSDIGLCPTSDLFRFFVKKLCMCFSFSPLCLRYFSHPDRSYNCVSNYNISSFSNKEINSSSVLYLNPQQFFSNSIPGFSFRKNLVAPATWGKRFILPSLLRCFETVSLCVFNL